MRAVCSAAAAVTVFPPALSWAISLPESCLQPFSSIWPQNPHVPPAFVSFPLRWFWTLFVTQLLCLAGSQPCFSFCGAASWLVCVITKECCSQSPPNQVVGSDCHDGSTAPWLNQVFGTWDTCSGVQQLVSTWAVLWQTELSSLLLSETCSDLHATVLAALKSGASKILLPSQYGRQPVPELVFPWCQQTPTALSRTRSGGCAWDQQGLGNWTVVLSFCYAVASRL